MTVNTVSDVVISSLSPTHDLYVSSPFIVDTLCSKQVTRRLKLSRYLLK